VPDTRLLDPPKLTAPQIRLAFDRSELADARSSVVALVGLAKLFS